MEMWHNGEQASGVTTAMAGEGGGTVSEGFHHISTRPHPAFLTRSTETMCASIYTYMGVSVWVGPLLAKIICGLWPD